MFTSNEASYEAIRSADTEFLPVQQTEQAETATDVAFRVALLAAIPPPPKAVAFAFELWVVLDGVDTKVAEVSTCVCQMAAMLPSRSDYGTVHVPDRNLATELCKASPWAIAGSLRYHRDRSIAEIHGYALIDARGNSR